VKVIIGLILTVWIFPGLVQTQETRNHVSQVSGTVFDRNGSVVPRARVKFSDNKKRKVVDGQTDEEGKYHVELEPGFYSLEIAVPWFDRFELNCYQIPTGARLNLDVTLTVRGEGKCEACPAAPPNRRSKTHKRVIIE